MLVPIDQVNQSAARYSETSLTKSAKKKAVPADDIQFLRERAGKAASPTLTVSENLEKRREMLLSLGQEPVEFAYERAIGKNDSVYSNFCELIMLAKRKVGRIVVRSGSKLQGYATGFMVSDRLMLTNWHVFNKKEEVGNSEVEFFYELDLTGHKTPTTTFLFAPDDFFFSNEKLDYCLVAVRQLDSAGKVPLTDIGYHYLDPTLGKLGEEGKEELNIIHHPDGDFKQLSIRENKYTKILDDTIWYTTDTAPGSSGSPVFNDQWQVVALHHMGVPRRRDDGTYLDKNGDPVPVIKGKVDASKIDWVANEGIRISVLLKDVLTKFPNDALVAGLKKPSEPGAIPVPIGDDNPAIPVEDKNQSEDSTMSNETSGDVRIAFPASLIGAKGNITINIDNRFGADAANANVRFIKSDGTEISDLLEIKKIDIENNADYSKCDGYVSDFLGVNIPLPRPKVSQAKFAAKLKSGHDVVLDYYYFSTIQHSVRKMPMISGINIDGNAALRLDKTERVDIWLRDNRLDYDLQLNDDYYAKSGFDRGHMSRREDANYGPTADDAKIRADMTCIHTNSCPQVPGLNRSNKKGLWGKLEKVILEKGVKGEQGKTARISVFNGPIFNTKDPVYHGIQVPMEFWKIILWFNKQSKLRATAFKLSQIDLMGGVDVDEELSFDTNKEFKESQCSIKSLQELTSLDFGAILDLDTFNPADPNESLNIESEASLVGFVDEIFETKIG